jgi:hypothetical protein
MKKIVLTFLTLLLPLICFSQNNNIGWWFWVNNDEYTPKNIKNYYIEDSSDYNISLLKSIDLLFDSTLSISKFDEKSIIFSFKNVFFSRKWIISKTVRTDYGDFCNDYTKKNHKSIYELFKNIGNFYIKNSGDKRTELYLNKTHIVFYVNIIYSNNDSEYIEVTCNTKTKMIEINRLIVGFTEPDVINLLLGLTIQ